MNFFQNVNTIEDLKKEYKKLAKQYHPDLNHDKDTNKIMAQITNEYKTLLEQLKQGKSYNKENTFNDEQYTNIIDQLIKHNIEIDIVGSWLWIKANDETYKIKDKLKQLGFRYSKAKKRFYLGAISKKRKRGTMSYTQIINQYGKETIKGKATNKMLLTS